VLTLGFGVRIYVAAEAVDLRKGFDGLAAATRQIIREDPERVNVDETLTS
jgi:hypothetical protein